MFSAAFGNLPEDCFAEDF